MKNKKLNLMVGYLFQRKDMPNLSLVGFKRELKHHLFELHILKAGMYGFQNKQLSTLDCSVGDWKCQTRASMIFDLLSNHPFCVNLSDEISQLNETIESLNRLLHKITNFNSVQCQEFSRHELHNLTLAELMEKYHLNYVPTKEVVFLGLVYLTTLKNRDSFVFNQDHMSINKLKDIINKAKSILSNLSIQYETDLSVKYAHIAGQALLKQIEFKGMQHMTSLFAGFKPIFKKMKVEKQAFLTNVIRFCECSGVQSITDSLYRSNGLQFEMVPLPTDLQEVVTVIEVYQYPGSLLDLQAKLGIAATVSDIPRNHFKACTCAHPWQQPESQYDIETNIMGFFAQHPQFTSGAQIDWAGLGLESSDLKKEYDFLLTIPGVSRHDMTQFQINHMYASTIAYVLEQTQEAVEQLKKSQ